MKKNINYLLILSIFLMANLNGFDTENLEGYPRINHYGPPYLEAINFRVRLDAKNIINLIPDNLIIKLLNQLDIKADKANARQELLKFVAANPRSINFYSIIWDQAGVKEKWPADRNYNIVFHYVLRKWNENNPAINLDNFNSMTPMGLFNANGVEAVADIGVPFEDFKPLSVHIHPSAEALARMPNGPWRQNELLFSPNNATFHLANTRNIATFWTAAVSPDKKNAIVIFNTLIDDDDILGQLEKSRIKGNLKPTVEAIKKIAETLNKQKKQADAKALEETSAILSNTKKSNVEPLNVDSSVLKNGIRELIKKHKDLEQIINQNNISLETLLNNIDMPIRTPNQDNLLMLAAFFGYDDLVKALLQYGADPKYSIPITLETQRLKISGKTASDYATKQSTKSLIKGLLKA